MSLKEVKGLTKTNSPEECRKITIIIERSNKSEKTSLSSRLIEEVERANRYQHFLSLIILEIDLPSLTDEPLKKIIHLLTENSRQVDLIFHHEGGKFAVILPETMREGALSLARRLKREVGSYIHRETKNNNGVRIGIASYPTDAGSEKEMLEKTILSLKLEKEFVA